jgi:hypothetical protein
MLGILFFLIATYLLYAVLVRLVFGKPEKREYYIVQEYDIDTVISEVMERLQEQEQEEEHIVDQIADKPCDLPDNVILFDREKRREEW